MKTFRLKCKHKNGQCVIDTLSEESSLGELMETIHSKAGIEGFALSLKAGYPPQCIDTSNVSQTLKNANIKSGDIIIAEVSNEEVRKDTSVDVTSVSVNSSEPSNDHSSSIAGNRLLIRHTVPANNSCLFTSINFCLNAGRLDLSCAPGMRRIIAQCVRDNQTKYNPAVLEMEVESYCSKILNEDQWGGGIELDILSRYYQVEIDVVDTQSVRIDRFGENENYTDRILVIYDGIHYDPLAIEDFSSGVEGTLQTRFQRYDDSVLLLALELANEAKSSRQFTDVAKFTIKCMDCNIFLSGDKEALEHATSTKHTNFQEV